MELVILGSSASCPAAGDACSGYLVRDGDTEVLLDCGSGVLGRLQTVTSLDQISAIAITHFHPDHYLDLVTLRYGLRYGRVSGDRPGLLVPPDGIGFLMRLGKALRDAPDFFGTAYRLAEYDPTVTASIGSLRLQFQRTSHDEPNWAIGVTGMGGERLVYTGDTRVCPELEAFASGADLLLSEATYPVEAGHLGNENHLTSAQAGALARRAGVRQLVLTHFFPGFDRAIYRGEAEATYGDKVWLAEPGLHFTVAALANGAATAVSALATSSLEVRRNA